METLNYRASIVGRSWELPQRDPHRKITTGFWVKETINEPLPVSIPHNQSEPRFEYGAMLGDRHIRILLLNPGKRSDPLSGSLRTIPLDEAAVHGGYEALSYMWGVYDSTYSISIDGRSLAVSTNLHSALLRLRSTRRAKQLWCDAVCIDQGNIRERSSQIGMMRDIYSSAVKVLVWLGLATANSAVGMNVLRHFSKGDHFRSTSSWLNLPPDMVALGLEDVMSRGWFQRSWIVQEAALAKEVVMFCGDDRVTWQNDCCTVLRFSRSIKLAMSLPQWRSGPLRGVDFDNLLDLHRMQLSNGPDSKIWARRSNEPDLLEHVYSMRYRQATDVRDKIYSVVGLVSEDPHYRLSPDYSKRAEAVYDDFADLVAEDTESLCRALQSLKAANDDSEESNITAQPMRNTVPNNRPLQLDQFIERACARALLEVRNNGPGAASTVFESAAMFLRSESFGPFR